MLHRIPLSMKSRSRHAGVALIISFLAIQAAATGTLSASIKQTEINTAHFTVRFQPGMQDLGVMTAGLSEEAYLRISNFLDHDLTHTIAITVWPSRQGPDNIGQLRPARGCCLFSTTGFTRGIDVTFPGSIPGLRRSLVHMITHAFIYDIFEDEPVPIPFVRAMPMPGWFAESLALYLSGLSEEKGIDQREVSAEHGPGMFSQTGYPAFTACIMNRERLGFIGFLKAQYGRRCIGEILRDIRDTGGFERAIQIETGKSFRELEADCSAYVLQRNKDLQLLTDAPEEKGNGFDINGRMPRYDMFPAVSPDGFRIAYLSTTPRSTLLMVASLSGTAGDGPGNYKISSGRELSISRGSIVSADNRISWSADGSLIVVSGRVKNAESVLFINSRTGVLESYETMPFNAVMFPSVSMNGRYIVFSGTAASLTDVYIYDRRELSLTRVTDDAFFERDPIMTSDGTAILYSTNSNESGDFQKGVFDILRRDIRTGVSTVLVRNGFTNIQPSLSPDGKRILYISNEDGPFNIYMLDLATRKALKFTNSAGGSLYPAWHPDGKRMAFAVNVMPGSSLRITDFNSDTSVK
jgi:Tol biopolymer transport system component